MSSADSGDDSTTSGDDSPSDFLHMAHVQRPNDGYLKKTPVFFSGQSTVRRASHHSLEISWEISQNVCVCIYIPMTDPYVCHINGSTFTINTPQISLNVSLTWILWEISRIDLEKLVIFKGLTIPLRPPSFQASVARPEVGMKFSHMYKCMYICIYIYILCICIYIYIHLYIYVYIQMLYLSWYSILKGNRKGRISFPSSKSTYTLMTTHVLVETNLPTPCETQGLQPRCEHRAALRLLFPPFPRVQQHKKLMGRSHKK